VLVFRSASTCNNQSTKIMSDLAAVARDFGQQSKAGRLPRKSAARTVLNLIHAMDICKVCRQRYGHPCDMTELQLNLHGVTHYCRIQLACDSAYRSSQIATSIRLRHKGPVLFGWTVKYRLLVRHHRKASCCVSSGGCSDSTARYSL